MKSFMIMVATLSYFLSMLFAFNEMMTDALYSALSSIFLLLLAAVTYPDTKGVKQNGAIRVHGFSRFRD